MGIKVDVQYASEQTDLPSKKSLTAWVKAVWQSPLAPPSLPLQEDRKIARPSGGKRKTVELTIRIVDETEAQQLNETWRQRSYPTNVLSFPYESPPGIEIPLLGDMVICAPVVAREASEQHKTLEAHWAHLVIHGTLHLLGYDHQEETQALAMETIEINVLNNLGYPNPYHIIEI
jgi:probable rRNA maturation factor